MRNNLNFKIPENLKEEDKKTFQDNAFASFCVDLVNSLSKHINIKQEYKEIDEVDSATGIKTGKKINVYSVSGDVPFIRKKINCSRKDLKIDRNIPAPKPKAGAKNEKIDLKTKSKESKENKTNPKNKEVK